MKVNVIITEASFADHPYSAISMHIIRIALVTQQTMNAVSRVTDTSSPWQGFTNNTRINRVLLFRQKLVGMSSRSKLLK
jgi:hypothetical protein